MPYPAKPRNLPPPPSLAGLSGHGDLILVVDDEPAIRDATRRALTKQGYKVLTAPDGVEALKLFHQHAGEIRLILTDMMMPRMAGTQLVREIRQSGARVKVIAATGLISDSCADGRFDELHSLNVSAFLEKPFHIVQLLQAIRTALAPQP
jgi:CheY-like chemotaxis protein